MKRRDFITLLGGAAAWPAAVHAQDNGRLARLGIVSLLAKNASQGEIADIAIRKKLSDLGWVEGRNIDIQERWTNGDLDRVKALAKELVALNPDALIGITTPATAALQHETKTIPIVFASVSDPIGSGFIKSLANPGGNITGFIFIEASLTGKWAELMRDIAPQVSRVCLLFNPSTAPYARFYLEKFNVSRAGVDLAMATKPYPLTADHFMAFSAIIQQFARHEYLMQCLISTVIEAPVSAQPLRQCRSWPCGRMSARSS